MNSVVKNIPAVFFIALKFRKEKIMQIIKFAISLKKKTSKHETVDRKLHLIEETSFTGVSMPEYL